MTKAKQQDNKGSEWRKWDLHIHTPASYDWDSKCKKTNADIIEAAHKAGIEAIAVTDHHSVESIEEIKKLAIPKSIFIIPGVELRTDKGNEKIHIIALFSPETSAQTIYDKVLCPLGFSKDNVRKEGDKQIYCGFEDACKKIHEEGGLVFLHAGNKSNGIEQLDSDLKSLLKTNLALMVDIFEINSKKNADDYWNIVFPKIKKDIPCVITSDSVDRSKLTYGGHSTEVIGKAFSWIKADLSFNGLRQIISEPKDRVCIDTEPAKLIDIRANQTHYINSIDIGPTSAVSPSWFQDKLFLSPELTAVIGKKGSGKSALVDILALCGKSHSPNTNYSFLRANKFRKTPAIAKRYQGTIEWADGEKVPMNLAEDVDVATDPERVKYLPQSFVEQICNEDGVSELFQKEINEVIFSYVPVEERLGSDTLEELIQIKTDAVDTEIARIRSDVDSKNSEIEILEEKQTDTYRKKVENALEEKKKERDAIKDPDPVKEPTKKLSGKDQKKLQEITDKIAVTEQAITDAKLEQATVNKNVSFVQRLQGKVKDLQESREKIIELLEEDAKAAGFDLDNLIKLEVNTKEIDTKLAALIKTQNLLNTKLDKKGTDPKSCLYAQKSELETSKQNITKSFDDSNKQYQDYLSKKKTAEDARKAIVGKVGDKSLKTIISLEEELAYITSQIDTDINKTYGVRNKLTKSLFKAIVKRINIYKDIYRPLIEFIQEEKDEQKRSGNILTFDAGIVFNKNAFANAFLNYINQSRDGSFQNKESGDKVMKELLSKHSMDSENDVVAMIEDILHHLRFDTTQDPEKENEVRKQINNKYTLTDLYNFLYQLNYLGVQFKILFNGKDLNENEFSPGEKGALLLIFYLLIDKERIPLIMDQPEENLDNESVYDLLVPYIKKAKERRQVVIVTHNPNLAVVCDAEQIICASMTKKNNEIRYESGSIENIPMNKKIVDVLEGTMPAFTKRDEKYIR
jgi:energy-coupling factor transporter ATP-binding protein EcfA2